MARIAVVRTKIDTQDGVEIEAYEIGLRDFLSAAVTANFEDQWADFALDRVTAKSLWGQLGDALQIKDN